MADEKDFSDISIDGDVATWQLRAEGDIHGTYAGTFKFRCYLTPMQEIAAGRKRRELLGSNPFAADEHESFMAYALSQLEQRVISAPPFWTASIPTSGMAGDIPDVNVINQVLNAAGDAQLKYKQEKDKQKKEAIERAKKAAEAFLANKADEDEDSDSSEE
jgi:hypothetical protein